MTRRTLDRDASSDDTRETEAEVPPGQQCTLPSCERPASDPRRPGALCPVHLDATETDEETETECDSADAAALATLADAIDYYHGQLDRTLPASVDTEERTVRAYIRDGRGWTDETIDAARVGYAPADDGAGLLDYLHQRGHDRDAILGTGLFYDGLTAHFRGRVVFPYHDAAGERPVYAIGRSLDHPDDSMAGQKYLKAINQQPYSRVEEPIYGVSTIREGAPLLITEGIADAIAAHQAGYACVSPVTKQFKHDDREELRRLLTEHGVERVHIVQDAEPPRSDLPETAEGLRDLTLPQVGEGLDGALNTAAFLDDADEVAAAVRVAELPLPAWSADFSKVDLDDYLNEWVRADDPDPLGPVLASAKPAAQHPAYDPQASAVAAARATVRDATRDTTGGTAASGDAEYATTSGARSALYDLSVLDVTPTGVDAEYRGPNPLGHHGESENYTVTTGSVRDAVLYDHKYPAAYNALTYLLVEAGERRADAPYGSLDDREHFVAWRTAKEKAALPADDPIPRRALVHVALDAGLCDAEAVEDGWKLPPAAYNDALETVREGHGVEPARDPLTPGAGDADAEHVAVLPPLSPKATARDWHWERAARETAEDGPDRLTQAEVWERTQDAEEAALTARRNGATGTLVWAIPTTGKTYSLPAAIKNTGQPATILTQRGRVEKYEEIKARCEEEGLRAKILPNFTELCLTASGEFGDDLARAVQALYANDVSPRRIHAYAGDHGIPTPCQEGGRCPYSAAWDFDPEEYDVLIGHPTHAYVPSAVNGRAVVFDEFVGSAFTTVLGDADDGPATRGGPDRQTDSGPDADLQDAVTTALTHRDALPFDSYTDLLANRGDPEWRAAALGWFLDGDGADAGVLDLQRADDEGVKDVFTLHDKGHAKGLLAVFVILAGAVRTDAETTSDAGGRRHRTDRFENGWERVTLDAERGAIGGFSPERGEVAIHIPPDLSYTRSVTALDGTPTPRLWETALGLDLREREVLDREDGEVAEYLTETLNHTYIRTTDAVKPYNSAAHVDRAGDAALTAGIARSRGERPDLITTRTALDVYRGAYDDAERQQPDGSVGAVVDADAPDATDHVRREKYQGNFLGSNDFAQSTLGVVIGSNNYGDAYVERWAALCGANAEADRSGPNGRGTGLSFGEVGDEILEHMREHDTAQAVLRFGRAADAPGAVVYIHTNTLPDWMEDAVAYAPSEELGSMVVKTWADGEREVLRALQALSDAPDAAVTTAEVAAHDAVMVSERQVREYLGRFVELGYLSRTTEGRGVLWLPTDALDDVDVANGGRVHPDALDAGTDALGSDGGSDGGDETGGSSGTAAYGDYYTWDFHNFAPSERSQRSPPPTTADELAADGGRVTPPDRSGGESDGPPPT